MRHATRLLVAALVISAASGCANSGTGKRLGIVEEQTVKRDILLAHQTDLTPEQQFIIRNSRFETEEQANDLVAQFLEYNAKQAALEDPGRATKASDVVLRNADTGN